MLATASAQSTWIFTTVEESFLNMSENKNEWIPVNAVGTIIGFSVFGILYIYTVISVLIDTYNKGIEYDSLIENDLAEMQRLGMDKNNADFQEGLENALLGIREEDKGDDQLYGMAVGLTADQWKKGM